MKIQIMESDAEQGGLKMFDQQVASTTYINGHFDTSLSYRGDDYLLRLKGQGGLYLSRIGQAFLSLGTWKGRLNSAQSIPSKRDCQYSINRYGKCPGRAIVVGKSATSETVIRRGTKCHMASVATLTSVQRRCQVLSTK